MSGVAVISYLLRNDPAIVALVVDRVFDGPVPVKQPLPSLAVSLISGPRDPRVDGSTTQAVDRVQVMVRAATYEKKAQLIALVRAACRTQSGAVNGVDLKHILADFEGPDLDEIEASVFKRAQEFMVAWRDAA
jgi:hypothetical protein